MPRQTISDLMLEQYALGELSEAERSRVQAALEADASVRSRLSDIEASNREILESYPAERIVPVIQERLRSERQAPHASRRFWPTLAVALPTAAALVFLLSFFLVRQNAVADQTRVKGATTHLAVFRKTPRGAEELRAGTVAQSGDVLQIGYTAVGARYGVIFSVDGRGTVTWHLPAGYRGGSQDAPALDSQGVVVLPSAYELDDAPGFERFFLVYSNDPFDVRIAAQAARDLGARPVTADRQSLDLPSGFSQFSLVLKKKG